jgi:hypothetical protein
VLTLICSIFPSIYRDLRRIDVVFRGSVTPRDFVGELRFVAVDLD